MAIDLYKAYKGFYQRSYRSPADGELLEMTEAARHIALTLFRAPAQGRTDSSLLGLSLVSSRLLFELEKYRFSRRYSLDFIKGLEAGTYVIEPPYEIRHRWNDGSKVVGQVYVATSLRHRGWCNVGATTIDLSHRISVFENRYRLGMSVEFGAQTLDPFEVKHRVVSELARYRVAACTFQESNGWYAVGADAVRQAIERHRVRV